MDGIIDLKGILKVPHFLNLSRHWFPRHPQTVKEYTVDILEQEADSGRSGFNTSTATF